MTHLELKPRSTGRKPKRPSSLSLEDPLEHGNLTVDEVRELKNRSRTGFYEDLRAGLVKLEKIGRKSIVRGPIARRYIAGEPL
jgi:hypothetical protein